MTTFAEKIRNIITANHIDGDCTQEDIDKALQELREQLNERLEHRDQYVEDKRSIMQIVGYKIALKQILEMIGEPKDKM